VQDARCELRKIQNQRIVIVWAENGRKKNAKYKMRLPRVLSANLKDRIEETSGI